MRELKDVPGFTSYLILNNDGIVIKYENMDYKAALHHSHQVLGLTGKAAKYIRDLFEANENDGFVCWKGTRKATAAGFRRNCQTWEL